MAYFDFCRERRPGCVRVWGVDDLPVRARLIEKVLLLLPLYCLCPNLSADVAFKRLGLGCVIHLGECGGVKRAFMTPTVCWAGDLLVLAVH